MDQPVTVPTHIAIICDGNRRWARRNKMKVFQGHEYAFTTVFEPLVDRAVEHGVQHLTFWIFSTENWDRPKEEVDYLMDLFRRVFKNNVDKLHKKGVRILTIGNQGDFAEDIQKSVAAAKELTKDNTKITVTFAMSYGGRDELNRAVRKIGEEVAAGKVKPAEITRQLITEHLDTAGTPDPDFIIRTSGEHRLSGFLLWQNEYAELWFPDFDFPEFTPERLDEGIAEFQKRQRRFGK
jgi:undecaprenyl diphosphate synthase